MAMISLKNLVAPVSNKLHLFSIMFVVLLFGFLRWSGGEVRAGWISKGSSVDVEQRKRPFKLQKSGIPPVTEEEADDLLNSMLGANQGTPSRDQRPTEQRREKPRSNSAAFDDIERSLGLK